jgi:ADP-ribose pyrophosphatase
MLIKSQPLPKNAVLIPKTAKKVFSGFMFDTYQWKQKMYDGSFATFEMLRRPDTVEVLAVIDGKVLITEESQPNLSFSSYSVPGGRVEPGEDVLSAIKRETLEETGMEFKSWKMVFIEQPARKIEWFVYVFVATGLISKNKPVLDSGEKIQLKTLDLADVIQMVKTGNLFAANYLKNKILTGKISLQDILNEKDLLSA